MNGLVIDSFAGGGGASTGIERALGRPVDIAINHDAAALAMHRANHGVTRHLVEDMWGVDPRAVVAGRPVSLAWFSPDCRDHSKAKGSRPVQKKIRALAWLVLRWAALARPAVIMLENVEEFADWSPLTRSRRRCKRRKGWTFRQWVSQFRDLGYRVEWRVLKACDYGAPTIRKRLFLIARRDGLPIVWPEATHGPGLAAPWRTAAEIIDWSLPCPSIFERKRPLADATLRRIARGIVRYVIEAAEPFIVSVAHGDSGGRREYDIGEPLGTVTAKGNAHAVVVPTLVQTGYGERPGQQPRLPGLEKPLGTVVAGGGKHALVAAFLAQHNSGVIGRAASKPLSTITMRGTQQQIVASHLIKLRHYSTGQDMREPLHTIAAAGTHFGEVRAFLIKYYGTGGQWQSLGEPLHTATTKARMGLVTVDIGGQAYAIADIGMRMLSPRELFRAQGFGDDYVIDPEYQGKPLIKTAQHRMCGNSVVPHLAEALVRANLVEAATGAAAVPRAVACAP